MRCGVGLVALLLAVSAGASDLPTELADIFARMPAVDPRGWAYTQTVDDGSRITVRRYDPAADPDWQLVSVDGRAPTADELEEHVEWREERDDDEGYPGENDFAGLALPDSWTRTVDSAGLVVYRFVPDVSDDDFLAGHAARLAGELTLTSDGQSVASFRLFNTKPFRTKIVAKVREFDLTVRMQAVDDGVYFPDTVVARIVASALFKRIDRRVTTRYTEFSRREADQAAERESRNGSATAASR